MSIFPCMGHSICIFCMCANLPCAIVRTLFSPASAAAKWSSAGHLSSSESCRWLAGQIASIGRMDSARGPYFVHSILSPIQVIFPRPYVWHSNLSQFQKFSSLLKITSMVFVQKFHVKRVYGYKSQLHLCLKSVCAWLLNKYLAVNIKAIILWFIPLENRFGFKYISTGYIY